MGPFAGGLSLASQPRLDPGIDAVNTIAAPPQDAQDTDARQGLQGNGRIWRADDGHDLGPDLF